MLQLSAAIRCGATTYGFLYACLTCYLRFTTYYLVSWSSVDASYLHLTTYYLVPLSSVDIYAEPSVTCLRSAHPYYCALPPAHLLICHYVPNLTFCLSNYALLTSNAAVYTDTRDAWAAQRTLDDAAGLVPRPAGAVVVWAVLHCRGSRVGSNPAPFPARQQHGTVNWHE